jgi:hypothetical protein
MKVLPLILCLLTIPIFSQTPRTPVEVLLPDPVAVIVSTDQPTILMKRCEAWKEYESLEKKEKSGAVFSTEEINLYSALRKALFTFSSISRPEAPNGAPVSGDISGCTKSTGTVL